MVPEHPGDGRAYSQTLFKFLLVEGGTPSCQYFVSSESGDALIPIFSGFDIFWCNWLRCSV
jgi:hypothetical protein